MKCIHCGAELPAGSNFCPACGKACAPQPELVVPTPPQPEPAQTTPPEPELKLPDPVPSPFEAPQPQAPTPEDAAAAINRSEADSFKKSNDEFEKGTAANGPAQADNTPPQYSQPLGGYTPPQYNQPQGGYTPPQYNQYQGGGVPPRPGQPSQPGQAAGGKTPAQLFAAIMGILFALGTVGNLFGLLDAFDMLHYGFHILFALVSVVLSFVKVMGSGLLAVSLFSLGVGSRRERSTPLFLAGAVGAVLLAVYSILLWIAGAITYQSASMPGFGGLVLALLTLGVTYVLLMRDGAAPELTTDVNALLAYAMQAPAAMMDSLSEFAAELREKKAARAAQTGAAQANAASDQPPQSGPRYNAPPQYNAYQNGAPVGYTPLRTDRSLVMCVLLSFVTCGLYSLYFVYKLAQDVNTACAGDGKQTAGLLKLYLLTLVTCGIYAWVWYYSLGNRLAENAPRYGMHFSENGTSVLMWMFFGSFLCGVGPFVALHIIIKNTNAICAAYNRANGLM